MHSRVASTTSYGLLTLGAMVAAAPIAGVFLISLAPPDSAVGGAAIPTHVSLRNLQQVWQEGDFAGSLSWSALITVLTVVITIAVAIPAGYALARMRFPGRQVLFYLFVFGLLLPYASVLIPAYFEMRTIGLDGTLWAVVLPTSAMSVSFGVFWMRAVFGGLPRELIEAARVDGAHTLVIIRKIAVPLARSGILVLVVLIALWTWNSFMVPLVMLAGSTIQTGTMALGAFQGGHVDDIPGVAASAVFISLPMIVLYVLLQRHFIRGMTEGALNM